jgi:SNF2 family DNA or RNA helicase
LEGLAPAPLKQNERIRVLIADEPGTGKTIEALSIIHLTESFPALIVCPASLKLNWARETRKWLRDKTVNVITDEQIKGDVVIINYDRLKKYYDLLITMQFKIIVFDESHALKNHKAQRSKLSAELAKSIQSIILLTGSPVMNRPIDLVHQLGVMGKLNEFGGFWAFAKKYCGAQKERYGWNMTGATNLAELNTKLRASCFIRRLKVDVLSELPPKVRSTLPLPLDNMDTYEKAEEELINWIAENYGHAKAEKAKQAEALVRISTLKKLAVQGKMAAIKDWVESFLETDQKLILFAWHQDVIERLHREFPDSVVLTGQTPLEERQKAVDQFQNDPACKLFIGNIQAGGLGITLTAASNVAFVELGWNPSTHNQAEDRAHRIGQNDSVTAYYLIGENTIDEEILALIEAKRKVVDAATEGKVLEEGAFIDELMQKMLERHGRVKTAPVAVEEVEEDNWF